jgi:hypothetical protein
MFVRLLACACLALAGNAALAQITLGQLDDFQDGTLMNWGGGASLQNMPDGGPGGLSDRFLQVQSFGGIGGGSRLATFNSVQWSGDYTAAGVTHIDVWLRNLGQTDLQMRVVLFDLTGTDERWTSTVAHNLPVGGAWQRLKFSLLEQDLTRVQGSGTYANLMADVDRLMFRHQAGIPDAEGDSIAAIAGIDNVRAAVPEPASLAAFALGSLALLRRKRSAKH